ncbi:naringenin-chalcone synthase [Russula earlei]|uniref:Naringenin-chalcone synthase n=1 Tax=Russula earlei TaxID=71964 RepID=A0ACC0TQK0_9AGAM|nr:naringenin-chalcone synthase [Russula earlei]
MQDEYGLNDIDKRKLSFLYHNSAIDQRYSVFEDFSLPSEQRSFFTAGDHSQRSLECRSTLYNKEAPLLAITAIQRCIDGIISPGEITHLVTVSCTGMSAPGLDLAIVEALNMKSNIFRTSVNFMGCYAAIHALKLADMICKTETKARVLIVSIELCTLHFQNGYTPDNAASSLLFADGCAAVLLSNEAAFTPVASIDSFYSEVAFKGKNEMSWQLGSTGFLMTLSGYVPQIIQEDIQGLVQTALNRNGLVQEDIDYWCVHPGGRKILDAIAQQLQLVEDALHYSRAILRKYGNMSSPTILFVLQAMIAQRAHKTGAGNVFGIAFGPGLTMETFKATLL